MHEITVGPWRIEVDPDATTELSASVTPWTDECGCEHCLDWVAHRDEVYSPPIRELLTSLGIDYRRETDVLDFIPDAECGGTFFFVGRILGGPGWTVTHRDFFGQVSRAPKATAITDDFSLFVHDAHGGAGEPMVTALEAGVPLVQLQFTTTRHHHP